MKVELKQQKDDSLDIGAIIFFFIFGLCFLIPGIILTANYTSKLITSFQCSHWPTTESIILKSEVKIGVERKKHKQMYSPNIEYKLDAPHKLVICLINP
ncbi:DUF3592 domain-containing protein [bacterium]|nr:DUF3592 domain-containing protein [bacterium]